MGLLSKKDSKLILDPLADNNPITIQVLGICSALAITAQLKPSIVMAISVIFVLGVGNVVISLMRNIIPSKIRIIVQLIVVATLVIIVDQVLKAFAYTLSKELSVFIGLIITNCIIMGRAEGFAMSNPPIPSFVDGIGNGLGYSVILMSVALIRELFGAGTVFGYTIFTTVNNGGWYVPNGMLVLPASGFFLIAMLIWLIRTYDPEQQESQ